ncbi:hypothetical protein [Actinoplanes sp. NPDC049118]|uniref:hypothetical protein n=1 Tax=Actinoplanes sp. NPDC049118 TaxID=3155769 RepID=UPI0033C94E4E
MTKSQRVWLRLFPALAAIGLVGAVVYFGVPLLRGPGRLAAADQWGSVVAAVVAVLCLPLTIYGLVLARRASPPPAAPETGTADGPVQQHVRAGRDAYIAGRDQHFGNRPGAR